MLASHKILATQRFIQSARHHVHAWFSCGSLAPEAHKSTIPGRAIWGTAISFLPLQQLGPSEETQALREGASVWPVMGRHLAHFAKARASNARMRPYRSPTCSWLDCCLGPRPSIRRGAWDAAERGFQYFQFSCCTQAGHPVSFLQLRIYAVRFWQDGAWRILA